MIDRISAIAAMALALAVVTPVAYADDAAKSPAKNASHSERPNCIKHTGTRIKPKDGGCVSAPGRVITRDEIEQSGAIDTADAIRRLAPEANVGGR